MDRQEINLYINECKEYFYEKNRHFYPFDIFGLRRLIRPECFAGSGCAIFRTSTRRIMRTWFVPCGPFNQSGI